MSTITQFPSGNKQYRIEFDYLARTFVVVTLVNSSNPTLNRVLEVGRDYRFLNPTMIEMLVDQSGFDIVRIHRQTGTDLVVDFRNGSVLTASDLTNAELQAIHIAEEGRDQTVDLAKEYADAAGSSAGNAKDSEDEARRLAASIKAAGLIGYITRRSFEKGFNVTTWNEVLLWEEDGGYYRWDGTLPKEVPAGSTPSTTGGVGLGAWVSVGDASLRSNLISDNSTNGDALITVKQPFANSTPRTQHDKNSDIINIRDFGAVGDWDPVADTGTDSTQALINAVNAAVSLGGAEVVVPEGIFCTTKPWYIPSNVTVRGSGYNSVIYNHQVAGSVFPQTNCIHVGYSTEWGNNGEPMPTAPDAKMAEILANNFSNITTRNSRVTNIRVMNKGFGLGIWFMNAMDCSCDNIWATNTTTPINIANDNSSAEMACKNISVDNIFQDDGTLGEWYDLAFLGSALDCSLSRLYNNPSTKSKLAEMIAINGARRCKLSKLSLCGNEEGTSLQIATGVLISGPSTGNSVTDSTFSKMSNGVSITGSGGNYVKDCRGENIYTTVYINSQKNKISGLSGVDVVNDIRGNVDATRNDITDCTINTVNIFDVDPPAMYNRFRGNCKSDSILFNNYNSYAGLRARKIAMFPADAAMLAEDRAATTNNLAHITRNSNGIFSLYYKIPNNVKQLTKVTVYGYGAQSGEAVDLSIVGIDSDNNTNGFPTFQSLGSKTTTSTADFAFVFGLTNPFYAAGSYYVKVTVTIGNTATQIRSVMLECLCDD